MLKGEFVTARSAALMISGLGVLYALPFLLSGRPYVDDLGRSVEGFGGWAENGRVFADLLMGLVNSGFPFTDLSPLPQLGGIAIICLCVYLLFRWTEGLVIAPLLRLAACAFLLLNPFLVENMAYKFDALPMAVSVLAALLAVEPRGVGPVRSVLASAGWVFVALNFYQAAASLTLAAAVLLAVVEADRGEAPGAILRWLLWRLVGFALAFGFYAFTIGKFLVGGPYTSQHAAPISFDVAGLAKLADNALRSIQYIASSFDIFQLVLLALPLAVATIYVVALAVRVALRPGGLGLAALVIVSPALMLLGAFGVSALLETPVYQPRVFMGFGLTMVFALLFCGRAMSAVCGGGRWWRAVLWTLGFFVIAQPLMIGVAIPYAFGAAQTRQAEFDVALVGEIRAGLLALGIDKPGIAVEGQQPYAPVVRNTMARFPIMARLVPRYLQQGFSWGPRMLLYYGIDAGGAGGRGPEAIEAARALPPDYRGSIFTLRRAGYIVVLRFD